MVRNIWLERDEPLTEKAVYHTTVHDMPSQERPRERLQRQGAEALKANELLAIILRTGTTQDNVIELAERLLRKYGGFSGLMRADFHELCNEHGMGVAKTCQLKAALEMARQLSLENPDRKYRIHSADDAANLVRMDMVHLDHEQLHVLVLDTRNQVIERVKSYKGTVNSSVLRSAEVFRQAIVRNCPNVIVIHNHPSGDPTPSREDIEVTQQLVEAGRLLDIELLDHIIIGRPHYTSLKERLRW